MITSLKQLLNNSSKSMSVDGSSVNKSFSFTASSDSVVTGITCLLKDEGTTSFDKFGAITALTNGILLQTTIGGNSSEICTIKDNADLSTMFHFNQFGNSAVLSILSIVTPEGFGNTNNVFVGFMEFHHPLVLLNGDTVEAIVRDNLSNIDVLHMTIRVCTD